MRNAGGTISIAIALLAALTSSQLAAKPSSGSTEYRAQQGDSLTAIRARPLAKLGKDALRFSNVPSLGGSVVIIELSRSGKSEALGRVFFLHGHPADRWRQIGQMRIFMAAADFDTLALEADSLIERGKVAMAEPLPSDTIDVCVDGSAHLLERYASGKTSWIRDRCGGTGDSIERLMAKVLKMNINRYLRPLGDKLP